MRNASFRLLLVLLIGVIGCSRPQSAAFTQRVAERLKAASKGAEVTVVAPLQVAITPHHGKRTALDLTDLWKACAGNLDCGAPVETFVGGVLAGALVVEAPAKREYLRPLIRTRSNLPASEAGALSDPLVGELVIVYVLDSGDARRPVMPGDLQALGLEKSGLRVAATANLAAGALAIPHEPSDPAPRVFVVTTGDDYAASRLLLLEGWGALKPEVEGDLLAIAAHQRTVFFTGGGEDKATLKWFKSLASDHLDGAGGLSPDILKWTPQGWVPFSG
jgi:hypothetical protein